jgi:hypothetical protein
MQDPDGDGDLGIGRGKKRRHRKMKGGQVTTKSLYKTVMSPTERFTLTSSMQHQVYDQL